MGDRGDVESRRGSVTRLTRAARGAGIFEGYPTFRHPSLSMHNIQLHAVTGIRVLVNWNARNINFIRVPSIGMYVTSVSVTCERHQGCLTEVSSPRRDTANYLCVKLFSREAG
eukprot:6013716-Pyramimonas_sp.AAC.2